MFFFFFRGLYAKNDDYKHCREVEWNRGGNSLMYEDYNFPIVALANSTEVNFLIEDVSFYFFTQCFCLDIRTISRDGNFSKHGTSMKGLLRQGDQRKENSAIVSNSDRDKFI